MKLCFCCDKDEFVGSCSSASNKVKRFMMQDKVACDAFGAGFTSRSLFTCSAPAWCLPSDGDDLRVWAAAEAETRRRASSPGEEARAAGGESPGDTDRVCGTLNVQLCC